MRVFMNEPVERMNGPYARRWWALLVLCLSLLMIVMANTALTVAAPSMTQDLGLSSTDLQWVIDGYTIPYAALMLLFAAIGDKYSRRGALVLGLVLFGGGAIWGSLVDSATGVIAARAVMGVGAALIMPATLSLVAATFPRAERTKAITLWAGTAGIAIAAGPLIAGVLLESFSWQSTFLINVPVIALAIVGAFALVPPSKATHAPRIDYVGGLLSVVWIAALVFTLIEAPHGWDAKAVTGTVVAVVGLVAFVLWELHHPHPLLDPRRFANRAFTGANIAVVLFFLAVFGAFYYVTQHLQFVLAYDALETGLRMLPLAGAVFAGSVLTGYLTPRVGRRAVIVAGMVGGTAALALLTQVDKSSSYGDFVAPLITLGLAMGLAIAPCTDAIMGAFPEEELGVGSAVNDTSTELGGAIGIAILGSLLSTSYSSGLSDATAGSKLPADALSQAQDSVAAGYGVAQGIGDQARQLTEQAARATDPQQAAQLQEQADQLANGAHQMADAVGSAFADAVAHTSLVGAAILGVGAVTVALLLPGRGRTADTAAESGSKPGEGNMSSAGLEKEPELTRTNP
ncbi:MFS transporter [Streptomyces sp. NPDC050211]|uniref:MFS transporter n=1 Tax=Streptomyces sp. NPDC050211 TaxID=3154932 RepID=UPI0034227D33